MTTYRADIDGLRAVAILSVVAFHAQESLLPGGFAGVDVFFVISGYLITSIIYGEMQAGTFTFLHFFARRARRILPALFFMLAIVTVFAVLILLPANLIQYGQLLSHTVLFAANVWFANESGYFDLDFTDNPLLHVWSLAIEEQFYFIWPPLLLGLFLLARRHVLPAVIVLLCASLAYSEWAAAADPRNGFFHLPSRAFELLIGAALAIGFTRPISSRTAAEAMGFLGLALIAAGFLFLTGDSGFPGFAALLPCAGTALLIASGNGAGTIVSRLLATRPMVSIGKISYSWYLWHWPPLAFTRYYFDRSPEPTEVAACLVIGLGMAVLSWRFIERPFRNPETSRSLARPALRGALAAASLALIAISSVFQETNGLPSRLSPEATVIHNYLLASNARHTGCYSKPNAKAYIEECFFGFQAKAAPEILLWGDSHARHYLPALANVAERRNTKGLARISPSCRPYPGIDLRKDDIRCRNSNDETLEILRSNPSIKIVILAGRWGADNKGKPAFIKAASFQKRLESVIKKLNRANKTVIILGQVPELPESMGQCLTKELQFNIVISGCGDIAEDSAPDHLKLTWKSLESIEGDIPTAHIFEPEDYMCANTICKAIEVGNIPLYRDDNHLSIQGARFLEPYLDQFFNKILSKENASLAAQ